MNKEELKKLREGDIIVNTGSNTSYVVLGNYGDHVTAVRRVDVTNPEEWDLIPPPVHWTAAERHAELRKH